MTNSTVGGAHAILSEGVTALILRISRLNGALLTAGDRLVRELGLTSARWQLLAGIANQDDPLSVAELARKMGVTRQPAQRIANELEAEDVFAFRANPRHKRARLIVFTLRARALFKRSMELPRPWAAALGRSLITSQISKVCATLEFLLGSLNHVSPAESEPPIAFGVLAERGG